MCRPAPVTPDPPAHPPSGLEALWVVDPGALTPGEQTLAVTLQGLVAGESTAIWIEDGGMDALLLAGLADEGVELRTPDSVWALVDAFREHVTGIVVYELETDSIQWMWSFKEMGGPMAAVKATIDLLPRRTRVVTAETFITLLRENFGEPIKRD